MQRHVLKASVAMATLALFAFGCKPSKSAVKKTSKTSTKPAQKAQSKPKTVSKTKDKGEKTKRTKINARLLATRPMDKSHTPKAKDTTSTPNGGPGEAATFGLYVFATTWEPNFCCDHGSKTQCKEMSGFGTTHLTLHGLWPNYTDKEAPSPDKTYPVYCAPYGSCEHNPPDGCKPDPKTIPKAMAMYGPGYVSDDDSLANHEWPKHGSCTGLTSSAYFEAALAQFAKIPGDRGTPKLITDNIGQSVALKDLQAAFGNKDATLLRCNKDCQLQGVGLCFAHDDKNVPTTLTACPKNTTSSSYDNGCVLNKCEKVSIQKAGQCGG